MSKIIVLDNSKIQDEEKMSSKLEEKESKLG